ncbi:MAG: MFS transporter [Thermoplasmatota archaeon]|nr:MFS transporter [Halobacteriales archaeon]
MAGRFTRAELGLVGTAAAIVFTRVFAFSLTTLGFTEYAHGLAPGLAPAAADLLAGIALGAYGLTMALAQFGTGILSDRVGRKPVLVGGTVVFVLGAALCAVATNVWILIAARLLQGLGGVSSAALAAVGETVPEERRTTAMALVGVPAGIGVFLGFILGPPLAGAVGFAGLFWATAALGLLAGLPILLRSLPAPLPGLARPGDMRSLTLPVMGLAAAGFTINFGMNVLMYGFKSQVLDRIGETALAAILLAAFVLMGIASRAIDRRRTNWAPIVAALGVLAVAAPIFRLAHAVPLAVAGGVAFFAAHAILSAVLPSQVSRLAGRSGGRGHGIQLVVAYLGTFAGGAIAGLVPVTEALVVLALVAGAAAVLVAVGLARTQSIPAASAPETGS